MDFTTEKQAINRSEPVFEGSAEQPIDCDVTLPDYCPDIMRILKCTITPGIASSGAMGDKVTAEGTAVVRIIYAGDGGKISCYEQTIPFSKSVTVSGLTSDVCVKTNVATQYCNCRAVNQRRTDIHGSLSVHFSVTAVKKLEILRNAEGDGIQLKKKKTTVSDMICRLQRPFTLSEVKELDEVSPPVQRILHASAFARTDEVKAITNKILLKGELSAKIVYCTESGEICEVEHTMPISQIIEGEGIDENTRNCVHLQVSSFETAPKADSSGEMKLLDIIARISAFVSASREKEIETVTDAYSTRFEAETEKQIMSLETLSNTFSDVFLCRGAIETSGGIKEIKNVWCSGVTEKAFVSSGKLKVSGSLNINVLCIGEDLQPIMAEKAVDFEYERDVPSSSQNVRCEEWVYPSGCEASAVSGRIEVKAEVNISAEIYESSEDRVINEITVDEGRMKNNTAAALTIYYSEDGESIWSIARRYNTTPRAIMAENGLDGETVEGRKMLLIPGV